MSPARVHEKRTMRVPRFQCRKFQGLTASSAPSANACTRSSSSAIRSPTSSGQPAALLGRQRQAPLAVAEPARLARQARSRTRRRRRRLTCSPGYESARPAGQRGVGDRRRRAGLRDRPGPARAARRGPRDRHDRSRGQDRAQAARAAHLRGRRGAHEPQRARTPAARSCASRSSRSTATRARATGRASWTPRPQPRPSRCTNACAKGYERGGRQVRRAHAGRARQ